MICVDARPIEANLRALDCCTKLKGEIVGEKINIFAKVWYNSNKYFDFFQLISFMSQVPFIIERDVPWEVAMHITPTSKRYDPLRGKVVWAKAGKNGKPRVCGEHQSPFKLPFKYNL